MTRRTLFGSVLGPLACFAAEGEEDFARRIFVRTNELRSATGLEPLAWSEQLGECARQQSARKAKMRFPGHDDPERGAVGERIGRAGVRWERCGENIFSERGFDDPVHFAIVFWWYSPGHQANMLSPDYTQTGVGVVQSEDGTYFATQIFVLPASLSVEGKPAVTHPRHSRLPLSSQR
jgi:uncharacterized protein YkwD